MGKEPPLAGEMTHPIIKLLAISFVLLHAGNGVQGSDQCWTPWFNRDNPFGTGDYETLPELRKENSGEICHNPIKIEVKTKSGASVGSTGDVIHVSDPRTGFVCRSQDQPNNGQCSDYKVRFLCPLKFCKAKDCWTRWLDRDDPSGTGDYETLSDLHKENPGKICEHPIKIEVKTKSGASVASTGDVIHASDTRAGFVCRDSDQPHNGRCADYQVRFLCPLEFCDAQVCRTPWFNRDNPSGTGDYETLKELYDENPNEICRPPISIEVQTVAGNSVASTGDVIAFIDTTAGFICKNADQEEGSCSDYKVRFICPTDFCRRRG
ncbi:uncharacterized protein LOC144033004 isoform X2 [Festucalex cinctus]